MKEIKTKQLKKISTKSSRFYILDSKFSSSGFTLVEMLVALGLFSVIVSTAMGGFVRALRAQRQLVALISANSNASLVLEQMSREIRTGFNFSGGGSSLKFTNAKGEDVDYEYSPADGNTPGSYGLITRQAGASSAAQITAESVNMRYLVFTVRNDLNYPPRVTIVAGISPTKEVSVGDTITRIQTTVSARSF